MTKHSTAAARVAGAARAAGAAILLACLAAGFGGCSSSGGGGTGVLRTGIPPKAEKVQEGAGQLVYTPQQPGRLYLYDGSNEKIVEAFQVRPGQRFAVDAAAGRATLEGNEVSVGKLKKGDTYQIFFLPASANP
jgi:hypothetical protein